MERALDLAELELALGDHDALPSPPELQALMATVEVGLFIQRPSVPDELLRAGWYLHGIASSDGALQVYTVERQRRAFQISAHVFDLALSDRNRSKTDRLRLGFAAQVGYRRGELEPNAMAIYTRLAGEIDAYQTLLDHLDTVALEAGVAFLGFEIRRLFPLLRRFRTQFSELRRQIGVETLADTLFAPAWGVVEGADALLRFLTRGDREQLAHAQEVLNLAARPVDGVGDLDARWVAAHLSAIADEIDDLSVWSALPPDVPAAARQALTLTSPPVLTLWKPQMELLTKAPGPHPFGAAARRVVLSVPTSAGKTLMAQMLVVSHLATQPSGVCFVAPTQSLCREVRRAMRARMSVLRRELGRDLPDFAGLDLSDGDVDRSDVDVMTPERLLHLVHRDPQGVLERYGLFVFDEAHMLAQGGRGLQLEALLSFLNWRTKTTPHRIVLLSAAFGNRAQLMQWLDPLGSGVSFHSDWRGPRRLHAVFTTHWDRQAPPLRREAVRSPAAPWRQVHELIGTIRLRPAEDADIVRLRLVEPVGEIAFRTAADGTRRPGVDRDHTTQGYRTAARVVAAIGHGGPVLILNSSRIMARNMARAIAELLEPTAAARPLVESVRLRLGSAHPLVEVLRYGVAFHHGGLPVDVLEVIEDGLREGAVRYVTATSTLTEGVNLPVRSVVLAETRYEGQSPDAQLRGARLINAMGRAGRATKESEGWVVLCRQAADSPDDFLLFAPDDEELEVRSRLGAEEALDALAEFEDAMRATEDAVFASARAEVADFIGFVWFVLSAEEELGRIGSAADVAGAIGATLAFSQLPDQIRERWRAVATLVASTYLECDPQRRRRWPRAGTSIGSARRLDALADEVVGRMEQLREESLPTDVWVALDVLEACGTIPALLGLPERPREWGFRTRQNVAPSIEVDPNAMLRAWLEGKEITTMADDLLAAVPAPDFRVEQMVDAVTEHFEHFLAWTLGVVVELTNERLASAGTEVRLCPDLPLFVRYGVDSPHGVALALGGVRSRRLSHAIAGSARALQLDAVGLQDWLAGMSIADWRMRFEAMPAELLDLVEYTRTRRGGALADLLETGAATLSIECVQEEEKESQPVSIRPVAEEPSPSRLGIFNEAGGLLAVVPSPSYANIQAILDTGLNVQARLEGPILTITLVD